MPGNRILLLSVGLFLGAMVLSFLPVSRTVRVGCLLESMDQITEAGQEIVVPAGSAQWLVADGDRVVEGDGILRMISADQECLLRGLIDDPSSRVDLEILRDELDPGLVKTWLTGNRSSVQTERPTGELIALRKDLERLNDTLASLRVLQFRDAASTDDLIPRVRSIESRQNHLLQQIDRTLKRTEISRPRHLRPLTQEERIELVSVAQREIQAAVIPSPSSGLVNLLPSKVDGAFVFRIDPEPSGRFELIIPDGQLRWMSVQPGDTLFLSLENNEPATMGAPLPLVVAGIPMKEASSIGIEVRPLLVSRMSEIDLPGSGHVKTGHASRPWRLGAELVRR